MLANSLRCEFRLGKDTLAYDITPSAWFLQPSFQKGPWNSNQYNDVNERVDSEVSIDRCLQAQHFVSPSIQTIRLVKSE